MDWMTLLSPVIGIVLTTMTLWVLNWLRKYLQEKHGIVVSDEDFSVAKRIVKSIEEKALSGKLPLSPNKAIASEQKEAAAIVDLKEARPNMDDKAVIRKIDQAIADVPGVGATGKVESIQPSLNEKSFTYQDGRLTMTAMP